MHLDNKKGLALATQILRVIGDDLRREIAPGRPPDKEYVKQLAWPWLPGYFSRSCRLLATFSGRERRGTGFFINPCAILTAAHCVYDREREQVASSLIIQPGFSEAYAEASLPEIVVQGSAVRVPQEYRDPLLPRETCDYALILLDEPQRTVGFPLRALSDAELKDARILVVGYPLSRQSGSEQFVDKGAICEVRPRYVTHNADASKGQSGSGIFLVRDNQPVVVAIHCSEQDDTANKGTRLTAEVLARIQGWLDRAQHD